MARYIDADKLLNSLPDGLPYKGSVKRVLIQAPTADVAEVRHGRYIADTNYRTLGNCSECGGDLTCLNNYCPNCGAKMDRERKNTGKKQ